MNAIKGINGNKILGQLGEYSYTAYAYYRITETTIDMVPFSDKQLRKAMRAAGHKCVNGKHVECNHPGLCASF